VAIGRKSDSKNYLGGFLKLGIVGTLWLGLLLEAKNGCEDFKQTKEKLNSTLRAYQCAESGNVTECKKVLGVGDLGFAPLVGIAGIEMGKKINARIRRKDIVLCPLHVLNQLTPNQLTPNHAEKLFWVSAFLVGDRAWAACISETKVMSDRLRTILLQNKKELTAMINEQKKHLEGGNSNNKLALEKQSQLQEALSVQQTEVDSINERMNNSSKFKEAIPLIENNPSVSAKVSELLEQAKNFDETSGKTKQAVVYELNKDLEMALYQEPNLTDVERAKIKNGMLMRFSQTIDKAKLRGQMAKTQGEVDLLNNQQASTSKLDGDQVNRMQQNLSTLEAKQVELDNLYKKIAHSNDLGVNGVKEVIGKMYDSNGLSEASITGLNHASMVTDSPNFNRAIGNVGRQMPLSPMSYKRYFVKSALGIVSSVGFLSAASAAEMEDNAENVLNAFDPVAMLTSSSGKTRKHCEDHPKSVLIPRDPAQECLFSKSFTKPIYDKLLQADDRELAYLFQDEGVCDFIYGNYLKYYPKSKTRRVNCQSQNIVVDFDNGVSINLFNRLDGTIRFKPPNEEFSIEYIREPHKPAIFNFFADRARQRLSSGEMKAKYPDLYQSITNLLPAALELEACCHPNFGAMPSEKDCARLGVNEQSLEEDHSINDVPAGSR
jgi:hypothetical protein